MRLLQAEFRKLNRPLFWFGALGFVVFVAVLAMGGATNAGQYTGGYTEPTCAQLQLPADVSCTQAQQAARIRDELTRQARAAAATHTAEQLAPSAAGAESAGLMASLPGVLLLSLLAGGHVGAEWSGRTIKELLTQCGRRRRVLVAKAASLWLSAVAVMLAGWAALAVVGPVAARSAGLRGAQQPIAEALRHSAAQFGRAALILAFFVAVCVLLAVVTRSSIGTMAACCGAFVGLLVAASLPGLGRWTPATWVQNWMGFGSGQSSITALPDNFWSRFVATDAAAPSSLSVGLQAVGLTVLAIGCLWVADAVFRRGDIL
jgi:ABC-type transport system involved in multi-copper enzyme maturation permease subunit